MKRVNTTTQSMKATYRFTGYEGNPIWDHPLKLPFLGKWCYKFSEC